MRRWQSSRHALAVMDTIQAGAAGGDNAAGALSDQAELSQQLIWSEIGIPSNPLVCHGILCYLYCKMHVMVHDTLCTDHIESKDIEAARQLLYS